MQGPSGQIREWRGLWIPADEKHMVDWMQKANVVVDGRPTYQYHKLQTAMKWVKQWRTAVDVGGHCGFWSRHLVKDFAHVHAFEPVPLHCQCFQKNVSGTNHTLHMMALGDFPGTVHIRTHDGDSGNSWVDGKGDTPIEMLDSFNLTDVDFIKLDCEGYELFALKGAEETLRRNRPCVVVEQKPGRAQKWNLKQTAAVDYLENLGATLRKVISGDYILSWD